MRLAWATNSLARHRRLPRLSELLTGRKVTSQSEQAMVATMHALASARGFKFTPGREANGS